MLFIRSFLLLLFFLLLFSILVALIFDSPFFLILFFFISFFFHLFFFTFCFIIPRHNYICLLIFLDNLKSLVKSFLTFTVFIYFYIFSLIRFSFVSVFLFLLSFHSLLFISQIENYFIRVVHSQYLCVEEVIYLFPPQIDCSSFFSFSCSRYSFLCFPPFSSPSSNLYLYLSPSNAGQHDRFTYLILWQV